MSKEMVRIDKWLWACRFYKTRSLAKQNIDGGKVKVNGLKVKPSREIAAGDMVQFRQGLDERTVEVLLISDQRRAAPIAQTLYAETEASIAERHEQAALRKASGNGYLVSDKRPTKKQRRQIHRFKQDI